MPYLTDTNLLLRSAEPAHPMYADATNALELVIASGEEVHVVPQVLMEFWTVATRPIERNGLGMSVSQAQAELARIEAVFPLLPDTAAIYPEWRRLITTYAVLGLSAHDARLVAAMRVHGLTHLLTFNVDHFRRYREITVVCPVDVLRPPSS